LEKQEVRVYLPRFRLTSQFQLAEVLKAMGMSRVFTPGEAEICRAWAASRSYTSRR
jgi:serine protease inhibitor